MIYNCPVCGEPLVKVERQVYEDAPRIPVEKLATWPLPAFPGPLEATCKNGHQWYS